MKIISHYRGWGYNYRATCAIGFIIFIICLHLIAYWIYRKCKASIEASNCKTKIAEFLKSTFYYGFYIKYLLESFMVMAICSVFTLMNVKNSSAGMIISAVSSWVYLLFIAAFICFVVYRVCKINDEAETKGKFKTLYEKLDYAKWAARHYAILFLVRRIVLVGVIMGLSNSYAQLSIFVLNQLWSFIYLIVVRPFERVIDNINSIIIELGSLACLWFIFMLPVLGSTDYSVSRTKLAGYWMMYSILASTNTPMVVTYVGLIINWIKKKKRTNAVPIVDDNTALPPNKNNTPIEEVKTSAKHIKKSFISNETKLSFSMVINGNQSRYEDSSLSPYSFIFRENSK